jgi:hypothetical protein
MINVNQITSQLARMPDQALQQYAMMHKNDPYTVSLALSESNRRKQMRDAAQGQQGMAPQPKVVDQGIAGMAAPAPQPMPEDVGIGALPAPNMQGMAGGGIVAFSGQDGSVVTDPQFGGVTPEMSGFFEAAVKSPVARTGRSQAEVDAIVQALRARGDTVGLSQIIDIQNSGPKAAVASPVVIPSAAQPAPGSKSSSAAVAAVPGAGGPRPAPAPAAPRAPVVPDKDYLTQLAEMRTKAGAAVDPNKAEREAITTEDVKGRKEGIAALKADQKAEMESMFKGREERIGKRESELGKSKDTNTGMAFLEAGLAMMQSKGRGLAGIAQGAGVGVKQYASGIKDIRAAQEKLDDARDRMEELRQNRESMNKSEIRAEESKIRDTVVAGKRDILTGAEKATGVQRDDFRAAVASNMTRAEAEKTRAFQAGEGALDRQSRERAAGMPSGVERLAMQLGGTGGLEAGLRKYSEIMGPDGKGLATLVANYAKDPTALKLLENSDPALAALVKQQIQNMLLQPQSKPTGPVRD